MLYGVLTGMQLGKSLTSFIKHCASFVPKHKSKLLEEEAVLKLRDTTWFLYGPAQPI
jgi:hypothetical protein